MKGKFRDYTGLRTEYLTVLRRSDESKSGHVLWWCWCEGCSREVLVPSSGLAHEQMSCGCQKGAIRGRNQTTHGGTANGKTDRRYVAWQNMKARCYRPGSHRYHCYGSRGVAVCQRWRDDYAAFVADVGNPPTGTSLDRINVEGHYSCGRCDECRSHNWPLNVRWATREEQGNNKQASIRLTYNGETKTLKAWAEATGLKMASLWHRLYVYKWSPGKAIKTPPRQRRNFSERHRVLSIRRTIIQRCTNPRCRSYPRYGGRGLTMCARWMDDREAFISDVGPRPTPEHSIDRLDNNKGYWCGKAECQECGPLNREGNCRWATKSQQSRNRHIPATWRPRAATESLNNQPS